MAVNERRVAVVGMAGVFPTCFGLEDFSDKLFSDQSLIRDWDQAIAYGKRVRSTVSGFVTEAEMNLEAIYSTIVEGYPDVYIDHLERLPAINMATADLGSIWAMLATREAIGMAGWTDKEIQSENTGVVLSSASGGNAITRSVMHGFFHLGMRTRIAGSHSVDRSMVYREAANVSCLIKNKGVCEAIASACATGLGNIGYAYRLIKFGVQDRVVTGGVEGTAMETFFGFDGMQILSRGFPAAESSRPFDMKRNGFVCSFGAGIVCLEEYEMAKSRGANILGVIDNYFNNSDGDGDMFYPSFEGQRRLWKGLLGKSGHIPDVVKVHGTSTPMGDPVELLSVVDVLGTDNYHISAPKSQFGHMLGAAGAVEFVAALLMLREQKVSPCLNSVNLNPELENFQKSEAWNGPMQPLAAFRDLLTQKAFKKEINSVACLNYGFGGTNSAMLVSKDNS